MKNRTVHNMTISMMKRKILPSVNHMKVFGSLCFRQIPLRGGRNLIMIRVREAMIFVEVLKSSISMILEDEHCAKM